MKTLFILRHAQKAKEYKDDYTRELSEQGMQDAKQMAQNLAQKGVKLDGILASSAIRTKQTAEIFAKNLNFNQNIIYNQTLYSGYANEILQILSYTYDDTQNLLLVGHNPAVSILAMSLTDEFREDMQMCSVVQIDFNCNSWLDIGKHNAKFIGYECL